MKQIVAKHGVFAEYNGYKLVPIYQKKAPVAWQLIIKMWHKNKMLQKQELAEERAKQVLFMIVSPENELVGVNTVYVDNFKKVAIKNLPAGEFYFYRMFIDPDSRVPNLSFRTLGFTYDYLKKLPPANEAKGLVLVTENPKLKKPGAQKLLQEMGWQPIGRNAQDQIIMSRNF